MTTAAQGGEAAAATLEGDDGFTAEERAQFAEMQQATPPQQGNAPETPAETKPETKVEAKVEPPVADDDDDGEEEALAQAQEGQRQPPRRVNYAKFKRAEERAAKAEERANHLQEMFSRTDERLKLLNEALTAGQKREEKANEQEDPEPDPEQDIFGWVQWSRRKTGRLEQMIAEQRQSTVQQNDERQLADTYVEDARSFATKEPQFAPAYQFLMANRTYELAEYYFGKDLSEQGVTLTPQEAQRIKAEIAAEERELVSSALKDRQSPAQRIFRLAKARGFRPQTQQPEGPKKAPGASEQPNVKEEIGRIKQGVEISKSLSQGGGSPGTQALTPERLANMSDDEFGAIMDSLTPAQQRAAMGG